MAAGSIIYNVISARDDQPEAAQTAEAPPTIEELRRRAEASTDDAEPWSELGYAHFGRQEFAEAAEAYRRAVKIDAGEAVLWSALGEALVMASEREPLPKEALEAFQTALKLDSADPRARYFMAVSKDLAGDHEGAIAAWIDLLEDTPQGAPWETDLIRTIEQVGKVHEIDVEARLAKASEGRMPPIAVPGSGAVAGAAASDTVRGPSQEQIAAASKLAPEDQKAQIEAMVASAEAKLANDPSNLDRWVMVMRSHAMLGNPAKTKATLEAAVLANPSNEAGLREQARALGIR